MSSPIKLSRNLAFLFLCPFLFADPASASDAQPDIKRSPLVDSAISSFHIKECCNSSLISCLDKKEPCLIATHLYEFTKWLVEHDADYNKIIDQLDKRYTGFVDTTRHSIDTSRLQWAGSPEAPVRISAYVSSTCNLCKHIVGTLYDSVTTGSLKGKARLMAIPFSTGIGDMALFAANSKGRFWQLFLEMRKNKIIYKEDDIIRMAKDAGIAEGEMKNLLKKPIFKQMMKDARDEGIGNSVQFTPKFFINEKEYSSYKDPEWVIDAVLFELQAQKKE